MARLKSIDGRAVDDLVEELDAGRAEQGRRRWVLTREQRLTYMNDLPADNVLVRGALWSEPERPEISVELGFAEDLSVDVGSVLTFDIQGVPIDLYVSSVRTVEWARFGINFFLVVEPGVLDDAPQIAASSGSRTGWRHRSPTSPCSISATSSRRSPPSSPASGSGSGCSAASPCWPGSPFWPARSAPDRYAGRARSPC
jgi:hypothetical protein